MPLFEGLSAGSEKSAVILDIGSAYSKLGFAGEFGPWAVVPSKVKLTKSKTVVNVWDYSSEEDLFDILVDFFHVLYFKHLLVNPKDRRVVFCESVLSPTQFRNTVAKVLFKHYEVPSILFAPSHLVAMFTLGVNTGLVLDAGYSETTVLPICEGIPIIKGIQTVMLGAQAIHRNISALLQDQAVLVVNGEEKLLASVMSTLPDYVIEDIKVRTCFVTNLERAKSIQQSILQGDESKWPPPPSSVEYPLDGEYKLSISGKIREVACEVLFERDMEEKSVATTILDSIIECPIDMRVPLANNLVLMGGTAMMPGFDHRLIHELKELLKSPRYRDALAITSFKVHKPPCEKNYMAWLGGSLFGAMEILSYRSLSREAYNQTGKVPDWCSLDEAVQEAEVVLKDRTPLKQLEALRKLSLEKSSSSPTPLKKRCLGTARPIDGRPIDHVTWWLYYCLQYERMFWLGKFTYVQITVLYTSECWAPGLEDIRRLETNEHSMLQWLCWLRPDDKKGLDCLYHDLDLPSLVSNLRCRRLRWYGHVQCSDSCIEVHLYASCWMCSLRETRKDMGEHCAARSEGMETRYHLSTGPLSVEDICENCHTHLVVD